MDKGNQPDTSLGTLRKQLERGSVIYQLGRGRRAVPCFRLLRCRHCGGGSPIVEDAREMERVRNPTFDEFLSSFLTQQEYFFCTVVVDNFNTIGNGDCCDGRPTHSSQTQKIRVSMPVFITMGGGLISISRGIETSVVVEIRRRRCQTSPPSSSSPDCRTKVEMGSNLLVSPLQHSSHLPFRIAEVLRSVGRAEFVPSSSGHSPRRARRQL